MSYYDALKTAWNDATQPPTGVTGTGLVAGDTTAQKIAKINAWTVSDPKTPNIPTSEIIGAINPTDFLALTSLQLQELQFLLQSGSSVYAPIGGTVRSVFGTIFSGKTTTLNNLTALVNQYDNAMQSWCAANGYPTVGNAGNLSVSDANNAGLV